MNGIDILKDLASRSTTTEADDHLMELMLRKTLFPKAVVTCGIVYLKGRGTIDAPPTPVQTVAKNILKQLKIELGN